MTFRRYAAERLVVFLLALFCAAALTYLCFHVFAQVAVVDTDKQALARSHQYANESFGDFLWQLVGHGSLGRDLFRGESFNEPILEQAPVTLSLVGGALFLGLLVAVPLGLAWARRPRVGRVASPFVYLGVGLMPAWVGLWLAASVGYRLDWFPIAGYCDVFSPPAGSCGGAVQWAYHLVLPSITLGIPVAAIYTRVVRSLAGDVRRARQQSPEADRAARVRAARQTALIALAKGLLRDVGWLIGATAFVDVIFSFPGLGSAVVRYVDLPGYRPLAEGSLVFATLVALGVHIVGNLIGGALSREWRET